jgi:Fe-S cluster biogenesis protein NfuA
LAHQRPFPKLGRATCKLLRGTNENLRGAIMAIIMKEMVQTVIDKIRPMLQKDGGDVELVGVEGGVVKVRLQGACKGCPMSQMTLKNGIERFVKKEVPEVDRVEAVN